MYAVWEYKEDSRRFISLLELIKYLMALTLNGRLFHKCVSLAKTTFQKIGTGLRQSQFVFFRGEGLK